MQTKKFATILGLLCTLSACTVPTTPGPNATAADSTAASSTSDTSAAASCELTESQPEPLSTPENMPVYEQFNFQPQEIAVANNTVTLTTPHHIFSLCQSNGQSNGVWSIASANAAEDLEAYDYEKELVKIANPDYETVEIDNETYEYRVRLQADWLQDRLQPDTTDPEAVEEPAVEGLASATEDAVFFDMKKPDGELVSQQLYTISELQEAQLGASLGVPSIAGAAVVNDSDIWFAASASQGEGDSGFASLLRYDTETSELSVERPEGLQGDQITSLVSTESNNQPTTLWMGTQRSGEGNPYFPASGLVAYQLDSQKITSHTITNSPLVGAIPHQLAVEGDTLWVGTGNGVCQVVWGTIESADSWDCWRFTATAELPDEGVDLYSSFLAEAPVEKLTEETVEVLWVNKPFRELYSDEEDSSSLRYEVVYEPGFEAELSQGGYRITNPVARKAAEEASETSNLFWPGSQWHWRGDRFSRSLDEVALNMVGGGPYGLVVSNSRNGFGFDNNAIRGEFDLLGLTSETTKVRYYSGWIESEGLTVYPTVVPAEAPKNVSPNPLTEMAAALTATQGP